MPSELISIRLQRNGPSVPWGFNLGQGGGGRELVISKLERGSMAERSGMQLGDVIRAVFGVPVEGMPSIQEAVNKIQGSTQVDMLLKRTLQEPPALNWSLSERNGQIVLNEWDKSGRVIAQSDSSSPGYVSSLQLGQYQQPKLNRPVPAPTKTTSHTNQHPQQQPPSKGPPPPPQKQQPGQWNGNSGGALSKMTAHSRAQLEHSHRQRHQQQKKSSRSRSAAASYAGPRIFYTRYSPRDYRALSPQATILHLHYHDTPPLQYYSPTAAATAEKRIVGVGGVNWPVGQSKYAPPPPQVNSQEGQGPLADYYTHSPSFRRIAHEVQGAS